MLQILALQMLIHCSWNKGNTKLSRHIPALKELYQHRSIVRQTGRFSIPERHPCRTMREWSRNPSVARGISSPTLLKSSQLLKSPAHLLHFWKRLLERKSLRGHSAFTHWTLRKWQQKQSSDIVSKRPVWRWNQTIRETWLIICSQGWSVF